MAATSSLSTIELICAAANGAAEVTADATLAAVAASPITPGVVFSGSPLKYDQTLIQATGKDGPYVSGAKRWEKLYPTDPNLLKSATTGSITSALSPNPKAPYTQYFLKSYGKYLLNYKDKTFQNPLLANTYCVSYPYALTFTYADNPNDPYKVTIQETKTVYQRGDMSKYTGDVSSITWGQEVTQPGWTMVYNNETIPLAPADQTLSYGYLKANPKMKQVVLTDAPGFSVAASSPFAKGEMCTMDIKFSNSATSYYFQFQFSLFYVPAAAGKPADVVFQYKRLIPYTPKTS